MITLFVLSYQTNDGNTHRKEYVNLWEIESAYKCLALWSDVIQNTVNVSTTQVQNDSNQEFSQE